MHLKLIKYCKSTILQFFKNVKERTRLKAGDPGAGRAGKKKPQLSRGDIMKTRRRSSTQKNENWDRSEAQKPKGEQVHKNVHCFRNVERVK